MKTKMNLEFHPSEKTLNSFLPSLEKEYIESGKKRGAFCNWDIIKSRHKKDNLIVFRNESEAVGFVTWYRNDKIVTLENIWLDPNRRRHGFGLEFQKLLDKEFKKRGDVALSLYCASAEGLRLANRAGFDPQSSEAKAENAIHNLGPRASYIKILKNTSYSDFADPSFEIQCFEGGYGGRGELFTTLPLNADFSSTPVYRYVDYNWWGKVIYDGDIIHKDTLKYIFQKLEIPLIGGMVALFDKKIVIPARWLNNK